MTDRTSRHGLRVPAMAFVSFFAFACMSDRATVSLAPEGDYPGSRVVLSNAEQERANAAIAEAVHDLRLVVDPEFEEVSIKSQEDADWEKQIVALFSTRPGSLDWIDVLAAVEKSTGRYTVEIIQYGSPWATGETEKVEAAVLEALRQEFGVDRVQLERRKGPPSLSP